MRVAAISTGVALLLCLSFAPAFAAPKGPKANGPSAKAATPTAPKGPKTTAAPKAPKTNAAPKVAKTTTAPKAAKADMKTVKADAKTDAKAARTDAKARKTDTAVTDPSGSTTVDAGSSGSSPATAITIDFTSSPNGTKLAKNDALRSKLESRLQAVGYEGNVYQAAYGFKNLGQFVAATNVSRNTGTSFEQLKVQMTGLSVNADGAVLKANLGPDGTVTFVDPADVTRPAPTKSLGQAVKTLNSTVDAGTAAQTATAQADAEIKSTSTVSR